MKTNPVFGRRIWLLLSATPREQGGALLPSQAPSTMAIECLQEMATEMNADGQRSAVSLRYHSRRCQNCINWSSCITTHEYNVWSPAGVKSGNALCCVVVRCLLQNFGTVLLQFKNVL